MCNINNILDFSYFRKYGLYLHLLKKDASYFTQSYLSALC
nr:MAG TPA: hypothetical protein [Caudoviricetes sp.]